MDLILLLKATILGIVEGLTEFLPISSTGHLILAGALLGFEGEKAKVFEIAIQTGAIVAVILHYRQRIQETTLGLVSSADARKFATNIVIAFLPAAVMGVLFNKAIKAHLFVPSVVASTFIVGGLIILWAERRPDPMVRIARVEQMTAIDALMVGMVQCLAMIPGTSRSGATIIGGMLLGLSREVATEFSFYLAIPTLLSAGAYSLLKERELLSMADLPLFLVGLVTAYASASLCVKWLLRYVSSHNFTAFAWYRIAFGLVVLGTAYSGLVVWADN